MAIPIDNSESTPEVSSGKIVIFSGHMIDHPSRETPRFPPAKVGWVTRQLLGAMAALGLGVGDKGICGGACGGDLLFAETALAMGLEIELFLPVPPERFAASSVNFAGQKWKELFQQVVSHPRTRRYILPTGTDRKDGLTNLFVANNQWMLETALQLGKNRLQGLILWDGKTGDGTGGTGDMKTRLEAEGVGVTVLGI